MYIMLECSQKWYRIFQWKHGWKRRELKINENVLGFAHGPVMFFHKKPLD